MNSLFYLLLWAGYNINYFEDNERKIDKWRSLLPIIILFISLPFIHFSSLVLLIGYFIAGVIGAFFTTRQKSISWWWGLYFISPVIFLMTKPDITVILNLNWIIAGFLSLLLIGYFLIQPGVLKSISFNSLFCGNARPYEGLFNVSHEKKIFGMVGTRPTGLARYSAITSLIFLSFFVTSNNWYSFLGFLIFTFIFLFSKGKTEMVAFIISMSILVFQNIYLLPIYLLIILICGIIIFGKIVYKEKVIYKTEDSKATKPVEIKPETIIHQKEFITKRIITFSGRLNGVWLKSLLFIKKSPLFGYGFASERYLLKTEKGVGASVDNSLLNLLLQSGIIGTLFFIATLVLAVIRFNFDGSLLSLQCLVIGIFLLIRGTMQSFSSYGADWLFLIPIIAYGLI